MGRMYGQYLARRVPGVDLAAVADRKPGLAESFAGEFGVARWYAHHEDLLNDREIDAVAIVTSTSTHKQVVIDAAKSGKAIFCEKPISLTLDDAREMIGTVRAAGVFFQMAFQRRFDAGYLAAKRKVEAGAIGEARRVHLHLTRSLPAADRVLRSQGERRVDRGYGRSRFRRRADVHGRSEARACDRRDAGVP